MAQDDFIVQWQNAKTFTNPSFAGQDTGVAFNRGTTHQWPGVASQIITYFVGVGTCIGILSK